MSTMHDLNLLGLRVRDKVTGLTGVCESVSYDLYGCIQAIVRPCVIDDKGNLPDPRWFDVSRLEVLDATPVMEIPDGRFSVQRTMHKVQPSHAPGPAEKPCR